MSDTLINVVTLVVLLGVSGYLLASLVVSIVAERRRSHVRKTWKNFGLSLAFCSLFLLSWAAQGLAEWNLYRNEQGAHGEPATASGFLAEFGQSTLENWQSEFLQLFAFVVLSAVLIHRGSAESKDSGERVERKIDAIAARLDELGSSRS